MLIRPAICGAALLLASCGPTPYAPAQAPSETGYSSNRLSETRYFVKYEGDARTPRQRVETYLLYRAAEVASESGHPYFQIIDRDTAHDETVRRYLTPEGFYGFGPRLGFGGVFPYYSSFDRFGPTVTVSRTYRATAEIEVLGARPSIGDNVFATASVLETLRPEIVPPEA